MTPYAHWQGDTLILQILLQPKASANAFVGPHEGRLKIRLTAPPIDGQANQALITFIAKAFKVPKNQVVLLKGELSRQKTLAITAPKLLPEGLML